MFEENLKYYSTRVYINAHPVKYLPVCRISRNLVCNALIRKGLTIFFFRDSNNECDFIIKKGTKITGAVQVCYHLTGENTKREIAGLLSACHSFNLKTGYIITEQTSRIIEEEGVEIRIVPIVEYLLGFANID